MSKHTPGPWRTYNMSKNKILKQWHIQRDDCKHDIALVSLDVAADERESVANLIAAAPAMYALLKRAAISLQEYCAEINGDMNDSLACEIEATIAQAEGVSHE